VSSFLCWVQVMTLWAYVLRRNFPCVKFFEIDHPATACLKAKGVETMGRRDNHYLIAEDLGERQLVDVLGNTVWDQELSSIIVAEGLLMYLPLDAVGELFKQCAVSSGVGSRIVFTYVGRRPNGRPDAGSWSWLVIWLLKASGEPWL